MLKLKVEGMTCNHCVMAVTKALKKVPGVDEVNATPDNGEALVEGTVDHKPIVQAVEEEGYKAEVLA